MQSYFHREIFTITYLLAASWPAFYGNDFMKKNLGLIATWVSSCIAMSVFTLLPANKMEDLNMM